ncbi:MAG: hypothetical protein US20_C0023G0014 [Candidatus Pacebacteria bacterium GW2011_GWF1_36_5]|nr:MAG: hypothetical protein US20_C0023G0014 [Candidatus Pacebacteria bacterium GW2011_GWF1_36_5]
MINIKNTTLAFNNAEIESNISKEELTKYILYSVANELMNNMASNGIMAYIEDELLAMSNDKLLSKTKLSPSLKKIFYNLFKSYNIQCMRVGLLGFKDCKFYLEDSDIQLWPGTFINSVMQGKKLDLSIKN